jgi:predicted N-acetyltransferase YhbS
MLHEEVFGEPEGKIIAQLVCNILEDETAKPLLSLVAEDSGRIVGHVIFSTVKIEGDEQISAYILAPLAVSSDLQKKGFGTKLINYGLDELKKQGVDIVLVLGDPKYYARTGFKAGHNIKPPYKLKYPEAWMALELKSGMLSKVNGIAKCGSSLSSPEYW